MVEEEGVNTTKILFKVEEAYHSNSKMKIIVYGQRDGTTYGVTKSLDVKPMSLHHKIPTTKLGEHNTLIITGPFKYF